MVFHYKDSALPLRILRYLFQLLKETAVGKVTTYLERIVSMEHSGKSMYLIQSVCLLYHSPTLHTPLDLSDARGAEAIFCPFHTVQRIIDSQPVDRNIVVAAKGTITEEWMRQIAELNHETIQQRFSRYPLKHLLEKLLAREATPAKIVARTKYFTSAQQIRKHTTSSPAHHGKQLAYGLFLLQGNHKKRSVARCRFVDTKQDRRVKGIIPWKGRYFTYMIICSQFKSHLRAKLENK